jgi:Cys-tRNA(Pro)/Cys-tRNA(Cys) deacylase
MAGDRPEVLAPGPGPTPATLAVAAAGVPYREVRIEPARSAEEAAERQGIPLGALLRTIVVRRGDDDYLFVLVPAGRRFDWPKLRAHLGVSRLSLPDADEAQAVTGYVGPISSGHIASG